MRCICYCLRQIWVPVWHCSGSFNLRLVCLFADGCFLSTVFVGGGERQGGALFRRVRLRSMSAWKCWVVICIDIALEVPIGAVCGGSNFRAAVVWDEGTLRMQTAIVFIIFRRPELTRQIWETIRQAKPPQLFIVADGPREGRPEEALLCAQARSVVESGVDWPCEVFKIYADANMGCARRVSSGLDAVFAHVTEAIILEDDCLPDPTFFLFCEEMLARYRDSAWVAQIAGCSYQDVVPTEGPSYHFSRYAHCWGWATWRRAWKDYDHGMRAWLDASRRRRIYQRFQHPDERRYWRLNFRDTAQGEIDSWAYRWTYAIFDADRLCVNPYRNLVSNIGFGTGATHTSDSLHPAAARPLAPMPFPLRHPVGCTRDEIADAHTGAMMYRRITLGQRLIRKLARHWREWRSQSTPRI